MDIMLSILAKPLDRHGTTLVHITYLIFNIRDVSRDIHACGSCSSLLILTSKLQQATSGGS